MARFVVILISISMVLLISATGALPTLFWGMNLSNYAAWFFIIMAVQLFIGRLWNHRVDQFTRLKMEQINFNNERLNAAQHINISCAYCGTVNAVKLLLGTDNRFTCSACEETNSVIIDTASARITEPIMPKAELANIFKNIDKKDEK
jgi:hypothetical protein